MSPSWLAKLLCPCLCPACQADIKIKFPMSTRAFNHEASSSTAHKEDFISYLLLWSSSVGDTHHFPSCWFLFFNLWVFYYLVTHPRAKLHTVKHSSAQSAKLHPVFLACQSQKPHTYQRAPMSVWSQWNYMFVSAQGLLISPCLFPMLHVFMQRHLWWAPRYIALFGKRDSLPHHPVPESLLCSTPFFHFSLYFMYFLPLKLHLSPASIVLGIYIQSFKNNLRPSVLPCNMDLGGFAPASSLQRFFLCPACPPWCYTIYSPSPIAPSLDSPGVSDRVHIPQVSALEQEKPQTLLAT